MQAQIHYCNICISLVSRFNFRVFELNILWSEPVLDMAILPKLENSVLSSTFYEKVNELPRGRASEVVHSEYCPFI